MIYSNFQLEGICASYLYFYSVSIKISVVQLFHCFFRILLFGEMLEYTSMKQKKCYIVKS